MTSRFPFRSVLVTGGAGFVGSRVVPLLRERGTRVLIVDNGYVGRPLPEPSDSVIPLAIDIRNAQALSAVFSFYKPDAILHLAAVHHIPTCEREPHLAFDVNVLGTQALLDAAERAGVKNLVFASSGAVYCWNEGPLNEADTLTGATDVYSITKLTNEYQIAGWAARTGSRAHIGRLFNTIGAHDPNGHLIPDLLAQIGRGQTQSVVKLGNTAPKRDYIYVDDVAQAFTALLAGVGEGQAVEHFNICSGQEMSVADLVATMGELLGSSVRIETDPARFRKIDRPQQLGDPTKMRLRRNWSARWSTRDALGQIMTQLGHADAASVKAA